MEALKDIPEVTKPLMTVQGEARLQKTDIFRKIMWFGFNNDNSWISVSIERVKEIQKMNEAGKSPANLNEDALAPKEEKSDQLNNDLELLDKKFQKKSKKKKKRRNPNRNRNNNPSQ